jgi:hypothetical protein
VNDIQLVRSALNSAADDHPYAWDAFNRLVSQMYDTADHLQRRTAAVVVTPNGQALACSRDMAVAYEALKLENQRLLQAQKSE